MNFETGKKSDIDFWRTSVRISLIDGNKREGLSRISILQGGGGGGWGIDSGLYLRVVESKS